MRSEFYFHQQTTNRSSTGLTTAYTVEPITLHTVVVVVVVSHIQRIGCQPEKNYFTRWPIPLVSAEQRKENKRKTLAAYPPPPPHTARSEKNK